jgi:hypothetical protein
MHGLIDRAVEEYLRSAYGEGFARLPRGPQAEQGGGAASRGIDRAHDALCAAAGLIGKPCSEMLEDLGAWLARIEPVRRLLRFSGRDFRDFLLSLEELPGRAELVLPSLLVPRLRATAAADCVTIRLLEPDLRWQYVLTGLIRGMADDYGALCLISSEEGGISVDIWEDRFAEGRQFTLHLAGAVGAGGV